MVRIYGFLKNYGQIYLTKFTVLMMFIQFSEIKYIHIVMQYMHLFLKNIDFIVPEQYLLFEPMLLLKVSSVDCTGFCSSF